MPDLLKGEFPSHSRHKEFMNGKTKDSVAFLCGTSCTPCLL